ncbi:hypothetical protein AAY473_008866 [Plecturocebus cupreus]
MEKQDWNPGSVSLCHPGRSAVIQTWLTVALTSWAQAIPLPPPQLAGATKIGSLFVAQPGFELLASSNPPVLASKSTGITGISHCAWLGAMILQKTDSHSLTQAGSNGMVSAHCNLCPTGSSDSPASASQCRDYRREPLRLAHPSGSKLLSSVV